MKTISSTLKSSIAPLALSALILFTLLPANGVASAIESKTSPFCTSLASKVSIVTGQVNTLANKVSQAWSQQDQKLTAEYQKIDQDVVASRQKADADRDDNLAKLEAKATTDAQKQAVHAYDTAVKAAVGARRAAYDTARQTFRTGVKDTILARRSTVTTQLNQFKTAVNTAVATAEATCSSNPNSGASARQTLVAALKTARQTFQNDRKNDEAVNGQVKQLAAARSGAFKTADQAFQTNMAALRDTLKQAFKDSSTSV